MGWWWLLVGAAVIAGCALWAPNWRNPESRGELGVALAAGALLSGIFFTLQERAENSRENTARDQSLQISLAVENDLRGADLHEEKLEDFDLAFKDLSHANLKDANLKGANLTQAKLQHARLDGAKLQGATLTGANLTEAVLNGAQLKGATLTDAVLERAEIGVDEDGIPADLSSARLTDVRGRQVCMAQADLTGTILGGADLRDAVLTNTNLKDAVLEADGIPANLDRASVARVEGDGKDVMTRSLSPAMGFEPEREPIPRRTIPDRILTVSDGDTIELQGLGWVRLIGVDAPGTEDGGPGKQAVGFIERQRKVNPDVRYKLGRATPERRWYGPGRQRAYVWLADGRFLNAALLEGGYARRQPHPDEGREGFLETLTYAQIRARDSGRRIWSRCGRE